MANYVQTNQIVLVPNQTAYAVSAADSGKIFNCPQTTVIGIITITLPAAAPGLHYRFINGSPAASVANVVVQGAAGGLLNGLIITLGAAVNATRSHVVTNSLSMTFVSTVSVLGDHMDFYCSDGRTWSVSAMSSVSDGISAP